MPSQMQDLAAWLSSYALHSTILLGLAWLVVRSRRVGPSAAEMIWKAALVGGVLTATAQGMLGVQPAGSWSFAPEILAGDQSTGAGDVQQASAALTSGSTLPDASAPLFADPQLSPAAKTNLESANDAAAGASTVDASSASMPALSTLVASAWLLVATLLIVGYAARRLVLLGRLGDRRTLRDRELTNMLAALRAETGVSKRMTVRLTTSRSISSPVALAHEICLPAAVLDELEPEQQRAMLAHELGHLVRRDPQWLTFSCLLERAFFFQPLNRLARRGVQSSAEYLADEWAARRAGGVPLARALVKVAEWMQASPLGVPVAGFAEERSQLTARVSRLLDKSAWTTQGSRWGVGVLAGAMLVATTAFAPGASRSLDGETSSDAVPDMSAPQDTSIVAAIIGRLRDEDADVRRAAAEALGRLQHPSAIRPLIRSLEDEDPEVRASALNALGNFERGVPAGPIRELLTSPDADVRSEAAQILGNMQDRGSIGALTALLGDANTDVRLEALEALDDMEAPIDESVIGRALEDRAEDIRQTAAGMAGERRMTGLVPALIRMLGDTMTEVRQSAAEALTEMRTDASHGALRMAITHPDAKVRRIAIEYMGEGDDR